MTDAGPGFHLYIHEKYRGSLSLQNVKEIHGDGNKVLITFRTDQERRLAIADLPANALHLKWDHGTPPPDASLLD